jgi:hypothetical protein
MLQGSNNKNADLKYKQKSRIPGPIGIQNILHGNPGFCGRLSEVVL